MKKQLKVGVVLAGFIGSALFGATRADAVAQAPELAHVADAVDEQASKADDAVLSNLGAKAGIGKVGAAMSGSCPEGMVDVEGDYCPYVEQKCIRWVDPETKQRCADFEPESTCIGHKTHKHFCIDRFEYPNVAGQKPTVMKDWDEAKATCQGEGKRLCGDSEWTLACEGQERLPYPYGYARSSTACNIDKPHLDVDEKAMADGSRRDAEVSRLDQRAPSGSYEACVSPYGAYDMTGNVDEWVVNESGKPYKSGLKGGYWGPVRDRCRPMTIAHNELFEFYQIGFRCCEEPGKGGAPKAVTGGSGGVGGNAIGSGGSQGTVLAGS
jgi:sulfatase modifying factor 1